jgi:hypothetical protein
MWGSNRLPPLAGRESHTDDSSDQGANRRESKKIEHPQTANIGVTGLRVLKNRCDEPGKCPKQKADGYMPPSRRSPKNFKATDFFTAVSEPITVCASAYDERVWGKVAEMSDNKTAVCSHHESNRRAGRNC